MKAAYPLLLLALPALAGCGEGSARPAIAEPAPPIPVPTNVVPARPITGPSLNGQNARALIAAFGTPTIDLREGAARKLQFAGPTCVLDIYLYPPSRGREAVATHLDTRLRDGRTTDTASCVAMLRK